MLIHKVVSENQVISKLFPKNVLYHSADTIVEFNAKMYALECGCSVVIVDTPAGTAESVRHWCGEHMSVK